MNPEEQLIQWLRAVPGRSLMSDSDGTIKATYTTGFQKCALNPGQLAAMLHETNRPNPQPQKPGDGIAARS